MRMTPREANTILVVDDDPDTREVLELAVSMEGYSVRLAEDTATALEILAACSPAMVFLDYYGIGEDTAKLVEHVRSANRATPIVLMTGAKDPARKARALGLKNFLPKPFDFDALRKLLHGQGETRKTFARACSHSRSLDFCLFS